MRSPRAARAPARKLADSPRLLPPSYAHLGFFFAAGVPDERHVTGEAVPRVKCTSSYTALSPLRATARAPIRRHSRSFKFAGLRPACQLLAAPTLARALPLSSGVFSVKCSLPH